MNSKKLILYSSVFAIQGLSNAAIPVLPELAGEGNASPAVSSLLYSGYFIGAFLTLLPFGILADRIGNLKVAGLGIILTVISGLFISFSDNLWILGTSRFVEGMGCGAFFPAAYSMLAEWKDSQRSLGEFNFLLNAGLAAGVFFSGMLAEMGIKTAINIFTILAGFSFASILPEAWKLISSGSSGWKKKKSGASNSKESSGEQTETLMPFEPAGHRKKARKAFSESGFWKIWGISVLLYGATGLLTSNYPDYSADFLTKPELGLAISASYIAAMLSSLAAGRASADYKKIIRTGIVLAAVGVLLSIKAPLLAFLFIGAGGGAAVIGLVTAVSRISSSGFAMGIFNTGIYAGLGLVPVFGSLFIDPLGYETVFLGSSLVLLMMLCIKFE
ncbi:multidrug transporter [Methanosarcina sp. 1.H.T.1A.1]|uniref:MFS transporter n=1 Tax=Methanosarcina sp. 1.H.T.1A.1 TaxID=1483602 RepID=UPI000621ED2A|nr:MFS transporter [Methanosarcina sp. 1.H.T.1A.1]KKH91781.1 multidrug transporter [Methanosarcina sp. 1.H.T.1A.1]